MLHLKEDSPKDLKWAILGLMNEIDADLEIQGYTTSIEVEESLQHLDKVLAGTLEEEKEHEVDAELSKFVEVPKRTLGVAPKNNDD